MEAKSVSESTVDITHVMMPYDANPAGIIHGGEIMKQIDNAAGVVSVRHTRKICVTASIDRIDFHNPAHIGNLLTFKASLNMVSKSSMEVGVRVEREDLLSGEIAHIASAYLTFVALGDDFKPTRSIPELKIETDDEQRRYKEAIKRKELRLSQKQYEVECQLDSTKC